MKKRVCAILLIVLSVISFTLLFGCDRSNLKKYNDKLSDYRYAALRITDDRFTLDIISGFREAPYILDGASSDEKIEYTVFTLKPHGDYGSKMETVPLGVTVGGAAFELQLTAHPFKGSYSTEVPACLSESERSELAITLNGEQLTAVNCASDAIDGEYALTVALDAAAESLKGRKEYEIYLRLTENTITAAGGWYWFACFAGADESVSVLMYASSGEIAALRT